MSKRQRIIVISAAAALVAILVSVWAWQRYQANTPTATRGATGTGGATTASGIEQPPASAPSTMPSATPTPAATPAASPGATSATKTKITPVISTLPYIAGGQVHLRAYADGASSGQCTLVLSRAGSAPVQAQAGLTSQGICQGFDVDAAGMTAGTWTARVTVVTPTAEGTSDDAAFTIN